jgi:hypothetical protein
MLRLFKYKALKTSFVVCGLRVNSRIKQTMVEAKRPEFMDLTLKTIQ